MKVFTLQNFGSNIIFSVPLTIDGINGGESIGLKQAVRESVRQIENIVSTSLETRDNGHFGVVMVKLQGRNRDDIMANVLQKFVNKGRVADCDLRDILLRVVPANIETIEDLLVDEVNQSEKRTLLLVSEGSNIKILHLIKDVKRKTRFLTIGYSSQSNNMTSEEDEQEYNLWVDRITEFIKKSPKKSFSIVKNGNEYKMVSINYYAKLNPREGQKAEVSNELHQLMINFMVK